jgi:hypothetical protein
MLGFHKHMHRSTAINLSNKFIRNIDFQKIAIDVFLLLTDVVFHAKTYFTEKTYGINLFWYPLRAY